MLEVSGPVQDGLRLVLKIPPKLAADTVWKGLVISEVCAEEILEFRPSDWSFFRGAMLMLMPSLGHRTTQKRGSKRDAVGPVESGGFKMVLTLLTKAIAVQVRISIIEFGEPGFQRLLSRFYLDRSGRQSLVLVLQVGFHELLEQPIGRSCCGSLFGAYVLFWFAGANCAWWNISLRARALCHLCGVESVIV